MPLDAVPAPPPDGSPWQQDLPGQDLSSGAPQGQRPRQVLEAGSHARRGASPLAAASPWLWLPLALSSMLLVLFAVVVNRQQAQAERLAALLSRVQTLEHSRALERTAVLEQQLRSMLTRLQAMEKQNQQQDQLGRQLQSLQQDFQQLRAAAGRSTGPVDELPPARPESLVLKRSAVDAPLTP